VQSINQQQRAEKALNGSSKKGHLWDTMHFDEEVLITLYSSNGTHQQEHHHQPFAVFKSNALFQPSSTTYHFHFASN
jgi:hypothetical protein